VSPDLLPGPGLYEVLRSVTLPDPATVNRHSTLSDLPVFLAMPGTPDVMALSGLAGLACRAGPGAAHPELTSLLTPFLDSPDPAYRYLVSGALPSMTPETTDLVDELGRRLATEPNHHVAAVLLQALHGRLGSRAADVDALLGRLIRHVTWSYPLFGPGPEDHAGLEIVDAPFAIVTDLAVTHGTTNATELVRTWFDRPDICHEQIGHALFHLRDVLNPVDDTRLATQRTAFTLLEQGARACRDALRVPDPDTAADVTGTATAIGRAIHLACDENHAPGRFADLALPVLRVLAEIPDPAVTRSIVDTCIAVADHRPGETLTVLADAVTGDEAFSRGPHGLDGIITLARRYLADHRGLLRDDDDCLTALRRLLEVFVLTGWDQAISLTEELDDLFR
jgi:hypothetical protein